MVICKRSTASEAAYILTRRSSASKCKRFPNYGSHYSPLNTLLGINSLRRLFICRVGANCIHTLEGFLRARTFDSLGFGYDATGTITPGLLLGILDRAPCLLVPLSHYKDVMHIGRLHNDHLVKQLCLCCTSSYGPSTAKSKGRWLSSISDFVQLFPNLKAFELAGGGLDVLSSTDLREILHLLTSAGPKLRYVKVGGFAWRVHAFPAGRDGRFEELDKWEDEAECPVSFFCPGPIPGITWDDNN